MSLRFAVAACLVATLAFNHLAAAESVEFNVGADPILPYTESGMTFTALSGSNSTFVWTHNGYLEAMGASEAIQIRATADQPFDLNELGLLNVVGPWRLEASSGAVFIPSTSEVTDLTTHIGWNALSYFDIVLDEIAAGNKFEIYSLEFTINSAATAGDFNHDGHIDAADFVVWRKTDGGAEGYNAWQAGFGQLLGVGSGVVTVPEPTTVCLIVASGLMAIATRRHRFHIGTGT